MKQEIGGDDARYRARRADQRARGTRIEETVEPGSSDGAEQIEDQELDVAHRVLDIVAEDPEKQHVAGEMPEIAVQEGIGEIGQILGDDVERGIEYPVVEEKC